MGDTCKTELHTHAETGNQLWLFLRKGKGEWGIDSDRVTVVALGS